MTEVTSSIGAHRRRAPGGHVLPILTGLLIAAAGLLPWTLLAQLNARLRPDLPWAAVATLAYLAAILAWLNGWGPPRRTADRRRRRLRLWPPLDPDAAGAGGLTTAVILRGDGSLLFVS